MSGFSHIVETAWKILDAVVVIALILMIGLVFANVVLRYAFFSGILGSVEMSRYLFVWVAMLSAVSCVRRNEHLALPILVDVLPPGGKRILGILRNLVICVSGAMLCVGGYQQAEANWSNILPMSGIAVGLLYSSGAVAGFLMAVLGFIRLFCPTAAEVAPEGEEIA